jgi:uncharacterized membrane protein YbaN (DUF454 family)
VGAGRTLARGAWMALGFVCVGLGSIGVIVPGLPTTVFFLAAASCFARSSPRFEKWVLSLPGVGPMVRDARAGLGMPGRAKIAAITMIWVAIALSLVALWATPWAVILVAALGLIGTAYIVWRVPTRERVLAERSDHLS